MTTAIYIHPLSKLHQLSERHVECPARIDAIENALIAAGLDQILEYRTPPEATIADLRRVHLVDYIDDVRDNTPLRPDVYWPVGEVNLNMHSWQAALHAAGAGIAATDAVLNGEVHNAFCLMRPIGHHATPSTAMGFCIFNNVAIAAMHALKVRGLERVAIVDIDVHHGNGTEEIFKSEPRTLMVSFYQQFLYPFSGGERRRNHMVNVPIQAGSDSSAIRQAVTKDWLPALHAHQPQMIFISAGFDAHTEDPLGDLNLVEDDYAWITQQVMAIADQYAQGRIVSFLEGGYNLDALGRSAFAHIQALTEHEQQPQQSKRTA